MDARSGFNSPILQFPSLAIFVFEKQVANAKEGSLEEDFDLCGGVAAERTVGQLIVGLRGSSFLHVGYCNAMELF